MGPPPAAGMRTAIERPGLVVVTPAALVCARSRALGTDSEMKRPAGESGPFRGGGMQEENDALLPGKHDGGCAVGGV